jgi:hypothetical protein
MGARPVTECAREVPTCVMATTILFSAQTCYRKALIARPFI